MPTLPNGQTLSNDAYARYWTDIFRNDPEMQRIYGEVTSPNYTANREQRRAQARAEVERRRKAGEPVDARLSYEAYSGDFNSDQSRENEAEQRAIELGFSPGHDWSLDFDNGGFRVERENAFNRNQDWLIPAVVGGVGVAGGLGAFGGAAGAGGGTGAATGSASAAVPAAGTSVGPGVGFGAGGVPVSSTLGGTTLATAAGAAPAVAGGVASAAGSTVPFWAKALAGLGGDAIQTYLGNRTAGQVNAELQRGGEQALTTFRDAFTPYMTLGANAAGAQNYLMGFGGGAPGGQAAPAGGAPLSAIGSPSATPNGGRLAPPGAPSLGTAIPRPAGQMADPQGFGMVPASGRVNPQAAAQQQTQSSFVRMIGPDGTEDDVHPSQVRRAEAIGARRIG